MILPDEYPALNNFYCILFPALSIYMCARVNVCVCVCVCVAIYITLITPLCHKSLASKPRQADK